MTGRELIIYILENGLENEPVFRDGIFVGFISEEEFATKMKVGVATVRTWVQLGRIPAEKIGDKYYISAGLTDDPVTKIMTLWEADKNGSR